MYQCASSSSTHLHLDLFIEMTQHTQVADVADSTVLAHVMTVLNERHNYGLKLILLSVDEGITGYRDDSLEVRLRTWGSFAYCYDYVLVQWNPLKQQENFLLQGRLSVLTFISVSVPPPCYRSST